nr:DUF1513 domain-containing protein [Oceanococcus sp. HetDA_MAG_MS8]
MRRRQLLGGLAAGALLGAGGSAWHITRSRQGMLVSCVRKTSGGYAVVAFDPVTAEVYWDCLLPARGHAIAVSPGGDHLAVFARRPGQWVWIIAAQDGRLLRTLAVPNKAQFNGHGLFAADGQQVWVSATSYATHGQPRGEILQFDWGRARLEQRWSSAGLDPHECALHGDCLVVANGGYAEQYANGDDKRLVAEQPPNLAWLDAATGGVKRIDTLADPKLSIRHLDVGPQGVFVGFQHADGPLAQTPLLGRARSNGPLVMLEPPVEGWEAWYGYVLSVHLQANKGQVLATSPRSGRMGVWDALSGAALQSRPLADVSGVAAQGDSWWASSGHGVIAGASQERYLMPNWQFDNHMVAIPRA